MVWKYISFCQIPFGRIFLRFWGALVCCIKLFYLYEVTCFWTLENNWVTEKAKTKPSWTQDVSLSWAWSLGNVFNACVPIAMRQPLNAMRVTCQNWAYFDRVWIPTIIFNIKNRLLCPWKICIANRKELNLKEIVLRVLIFHNA